MLSVSIYFAQVDTEHFSASFMENIEGFHFLFCSVASEKETPKKDVEIVETKPVERQIEARSFDDTFTGLVRCLSLVECNLLSCEYFSRLYLKKLWKQTCSFCCLIAVNTKTPTLWVGNNGGTIFIYTLNLPAADKRAETGVQFRLGGKFRMKFPKLSIETI